jgi:hypothetical membrane protein
VRGGSSFYPNPHLEQPLAFSNSVKAGTAFFVAGVEFSIGMILAEIYYPGYNVSTNYISDLGATCTSTCVFHQPTATIFDSSIIILGLLAWVGGYFLQKSFRWMPLTILTMLAGLGAVGVGVFNESFSTLHHIFSLIVFLFAGLAAIAAFKVEKGPLRYLSVLMGLATLVALLLYIPNVYLGLGAGGMERMIVYPVLLWLIGFGAYLMGTGSEQKPAEAPAGAPTA